MVGQVVSACRLTGHCIGWDTQSKNIPVYPSLSVKIYNHAWFSEPRVWTTRCCKANTFEVLSVTWISDVGRIFWSWFLNVCVRGLIKYSWFYTQNSVTIPACGGCECATAIHHSSNISFVVYNHPSFLLLYFIVRQIPQIIFANFIGIVCEICHLAVVERNVWRHKQDK